MSAADCPPRGPGAAVTRPKHASPLAAPLHTVAPLTSRPVPHQPRFVSTWGDAFRYAHRAGYTRVTDSQHTVDLDSVMVAWEASRPSVPAEVAAQELGNGDLIVLEAEDGVIRHGTTALLVFSGRSPPSPWWRRALAALKAWHRP